MRFGEMGGGGYGSLAQGLRTCALKTTEVYNFIENNGIYKLQMKQRHKTGDLAPKGHGQEQVEW